MSTVEWTQLSMPRAEPAPKRLWTLGDEWLDSGKSAVLRVPSAIVVGEFNFC